MPAGPVQNLFSSCWPSKNVTIKMCETIQFCDFFFFFFFGMVPCIQEERSLRVFDTNAYRVSMGKFEGKRSLAKLGNGWGYNMNVDLKEIGWEGED